MKAVVSGTVLARWLHADERSGNDAGGLRWWRGLQRRRRSYRFAFVSRRQPTHWCSRHRSWYPQCQFGNGTSVQFSTISANSSSFNAGGIANAGTLVVTGATIALNKATNRGGGISQIQGAQTATIRSSIIGVNSAPQGADLDAMVGTFVSAGFNLIASDDANVFPAAMTDREGTLAVPVRLGLLPLADNGGPTLTHATCARVMATTWATRCSTMSTSAAVSVFGGVRDIGAYELQSVCPPTPFAPTTPVASAANTFSVYPTQTRGNLTIEMTDESTFTTQSDGDYTFRIVDASGMLIREVRSNSDRFEFDANGLEAGSYFVQRVSGTGVESRMFQILN